MKTGVFVILILLSVVLLVPCQYFLLSNETYPIEYNISLKTHFNSSDMFDGEVEIRIGVQAATNSIQLILGYNKLNTVELLEFDGYRKIPIRYQLHQLIGYLSIQSEEMLVQGKEYIIKFSCVGAYQNDKSRVSDDGHIQGITTDFIPYYKSISRLLPCYSDITFSVKLTLSIQHPVGYYAISNMDVLDTTTDDATATITTTFRTSPTLPFHSLAFAVLNYKSHCNDGDLKICVYYDEQHSVADVELVFETTIKTIVELSNYLEVILDLPKLDIIPISYSSSDTVGGYGILTNNEIYFYYNSTTSGLVHKDEVIRHTIRQVLNLYLGNILDLEFSDNIWLIQGLSVLFEYLIADKLYPEFDEMNQFLSNLYTSGFTDNPVKLSGNGTLNYPHISLLYYHIDMEYKSAGILYMLKGIVGEHVFKNGLRKILSDSRSQLSNSKLFFDIFTQLAIEGNMLPNHYDLNIVMNTWLTELRYPMVGVIRTYTPLTNTSMRLYQTDIINLDEEEFRSTNWWIPYTCVSQFDSISEWTKSSASRWLENVSEEIVEHGFGTKLDGNSWIICNQEQSGFYYIDYDSNNYMLLANQLNRDHTKIPALTRAQLLHVGFKSALNQRNSLGLIFQLCNYIHRENTYASVNTFIDQFSKFAVRLYGTEPYENITKFVVHKIGRIYDRVRPTQLDTDPTNLSFNDEKIRKTIVFMACANGYKNCLEDMNVLLEDAISNNKISSLITNELGTYISHFGMVLANENLFWKMVAIGNEFTELIGALALVHDSKLLNELFTILDAQNGNIINGVQINISAPDRSLMLQTLTSHNLPALDKTVDYMIEKSTTIKESFGELYFVMRSFTTYSIKTKERLEKFRELVELYKSPTQTFEYFLKVAERNVEWCSSRIKEFQNILSEILNDIDDNDDNEDEDEDDENDGATVLSNSMILLFSLIVFSVNCFYENLFV